MLIEPIMTLFFDLRVIDCCGHGADKKSSNKKILDNFGGR